MVEIRPWKPGDEDAILALFQDVFGQAMSPEYWRWRFEHHPDGGPLIMLAWDGERLAGHYAVSRAPLMVGGRIQRAALSMTTMTHSDYRGQDLFSRMATALYDELAAQGFVAVLGFPNRMSHVPFRQKLDWIDIEEISTMVLRGDRLRRKPTVDPDVDEIGSIDERVGALARDVASEAGFAGARDTRILRWRVDENPVNEYRRFVLGGGDRAAADAEAYAITKPYGEAGLDLVEFGARDETAAKRMVDHVAALAFEEGIAQINCWCVPGAPHRLVLERAGFAADAPVTYFGGRAFHPLDDDFGDARRWRVSMLDSDLY